MELYSSRRTAAEAVGISKDTWQRVEEAQVVREVTYAKVDRALGWAAGSCVEVAEGGEPVLVGGADGDGVPAEGVSALDPETVRRAAFDAARATLPTASIGDLDAFTDELIEALRRSGDVAE